jgi:leader peptidase (prepilin peptidase)/N-methyltransferase
MSIVLPVFAFLVGIVLGSFMNVLIFRLPREISIVKPRSFCPQCKKPIPWYENIPIISFILLRGRCARCRAPISWQYPVVEALTGIVFLFLYFRYQPGRDFLFYMFFFCGLIVLSGIDFTHQLIPDAITIPGIILGLLNQLLHHTLLLGLIGAVFGGGLILLIRVLGGRAYKKEVMGMGDVYLTAMIGAYVGFPNVIFAIFVAALTGAISGIAYLAVSRKHRETPIPFGPFLSLGGMAAIVFKIQLYYIIERLTLRF